MSHKNLPKLATKTTTKTTTTTATVNPALWTLEKVGWMDRQKTEVKARVEAGASKMWCRRAGIGKVELGLRAQARHQAPEKAKSWLLSVAECAIDNGHHSVVEGHKLIITIAK